MEIQKIAIGKIIPNDYNPNRIDKNILLSLVNNIKRDGEMIQPILVKKKGDLFEIIDGEQRYKASKDAGLKEIYCVIVKSSNDASKLQTVAMNRLRGKIDEIELAKLLNDINPGLYNDICIGYDFDEIELLGKIPEIDIDDEAEAERSNSKMELYFKFLTTKLQHKYLKSKFPNESAKNTQKLISIIKTSKVK